jgi:hypothetical protein
MREVNGSCSRLRGLFRILRGIAARQLTRAELPALLQNAHSKIVNFSVILSDVTGHAIKVVGNEKVGGSGIWHMLGVGLESRTLAIYIILASNFDAVFYSMYFRFCQIKQN